MIKSRNIIQPGNITLKQLTKQWNHKIGKLKWEQMGNYRKR